MKNITVSVDDELYHAARVAAAHRKTNVSAVVRRYLAAFAKGKAPLLDSDDADADRESRERLAGLFAEANLVLGYPPSREKTYER